MRSLIPAPWFTKISAGAEKETIVAERLSHPGGDAPSFAADKKITDISSIFMSAAIKTLDDPSKQPHNRGLHLKKYEGSAQMEAM
jgi:hypothetical protein